MLVYIGDIGFFGYFWLFRVKSGKISKRWDRYGQ